jgi:hypothetical protein
MPDSKQARYRFRAIARPQTRERDRTFARIFVASSQGPRLLCRPLSDGRLSLGKYVHRPACEANPQLSVVGVQGIAWVADCIHAAIDRRLGVEEFSPGARVTVKAHSVLSVAPLSVARVNHNQQNVAGIVPTFERDDIIVAVGMCDCGENAVPDGSNEDCSRL